MSSSVAGPGRFATTRWSLVLRARADDRRVARSALDALCRQSWYPLYGYLRRRGFDASDAQDLTQGFFASLLEGKHLERLAPDRGRLRSFLLVALKHYASNERRRERAIRRGEGRAPIPIDLGEAEERFRLEPAHGETPERLYERRWALERLERVLETLEGEYRAAGRRHVFDCLRGALVGAPPKSADAAAALGTSEGAVRVAIHRLRRRYAELLRLEIAQTVADPADVEDELRRLFAAVSNAESGGSR